MRRIILTLAATAGLALSVFAAPVLAGSATPAQASGSFTLYSGWDGAYSYDYGPGSIITGWDTGTPYVTTGASGKYVEILAIDNYCLQLYGPDGGVYYVYENYCNDSASQLWWFDDVHGNGVYQVINKSLSSKLGKNACLWNADETSVNGIIYEDIRVQACTSSNRANWVKK